MRTDLDVSAEVFLANVDRLRRAGERAQRQLSSGKRIESASDAPDQVGALLQLRATLDRNTRVSANLSRAGAEADIADEALGQAGKLLDRALTLASQGANELQTSATRANMAQEIGGIIEQLVSITATRAEGRFIFGGDDDMDPPYDVDWTQANGVRQLTWAQATRRVEDASGNAFPSSLPARDIFDVRDGWGAPAAGNVFAALGRLKTALENDDVASVEGGLALLRTASEHLNHQIGFYGALQNRIDNGVDLASKWEVRLRAEMSAMEDADIAAAAVEVTQGNVHLQAALSARAQAPTATLFDLLK